MEKLTKEEREACIPVENVRYEGTKAVWLREKKDIFRLMRIWLHKPILLVENGKHEHLGIKSENIYTVLFLLDGDRTYMYALKKKGGHNRREEENRQEKD